jgi:hypothetical protein
MACTAQAALYAEFGWEDGVSTVQSYYVSGSAELTFENSMDVASEGRRSLMIMEEPRNSTPQAFIFWVTGLDQGDAVVSSFDVYDVTPGASPSGRIWGHKTVDGDIDSYAGSVGGNSTYSDGYGWTNLQQTWFFESEGPETNGIVVEARIYSGTGSVQGTNDGGNVIYVDRAWVVVSNDNAMIQLPDGSYVPEPVLGLGVLAGLVLLRRV